MGKTDRPAWVKHIRKLLEQAKAKDSDLAVFGAHSHRYRLAASAGEERIQAFEKQYGIGLPEEWIRIIDSFYKFEKLPELHGEAFRDACYIFKGTKDRPNVHAGRLKEALMRKDLDRNERSVLFYCIRELKGKEEVLDHFPDHLSTEEDPYLLIYAIQAMDGVKGRRLRERYVELLDRYRTHENAKLDYKGSQMVLRGGSCMGVSRPEGQIISNLLRQFDQFGLDYRGAWKLLMDDGRWEEWKRTGYLRW